MGYLEALEQKLKGVFGEKLESSVIALKELTIEVDVKNMMEVFQTLRDHSEFQFEQLMDVCGVDYLDYGVSEWTTGEATFTGFSRGVDTEGRKTTWKKPRFAAVYHLLSQTLNHRIRVRVFAVGEPPILPTVTPIWNSANWYEREAFDLYGILFDEHPDLRRILTDYGFIGHPFRKDFPLIGTVEMRYSEQEKRVVYEPVSIDPRTLVPKTIPKDYRYVELGEKG